MFTVYVLYSEKFKRIYIGYTSNLIERIKWHNQLAYKGYTIAYRPWVVVYTEFFETSTEARVRELKLKSRNSRLWIKENVIPRFVDIGFISN